MTGKHEVSNIHNMHIFGCNLAELLGSPHHVPYEIRHHLHKKVAY